MRKNLTVGCRLNSRDTLSLGATGDAMVASLDILRAHGKGEKANEDKEVEAAAVQVLRRLRTLCRPAKFTMGNKEMGKHYEEEEMK